MYYKSVFSSFSFIDNQCRYINEISRKNPINFRGWCFNSKSFVVIWNSSIQRILGGNHQIFRDSPRSFSYNHKYLIWINFNVLQVYWLYIMRTCLFPILNLNLLYTKKKHQKKIRQYVKQITLYCCERVLSDNIIPSICKHFQSQSLQKLMS